MKAIIPVAEKFNMQMALHPDDPPITPLRGIARILINGRNFRRVRQAVIVRVRVQGLRRVRPVYLGTVPDPVVVRVSVPGVGP